MLVWLENNTDITRIAQKAENGPTNFQTLLMHGPVTNVKHLNPLLVDQVPYGLIRALLCPLTHWQGGGEGEMSACARFKENPRLVSISPLLSGLCTSDTWPDNDSEKKGSS